MFRPLPCAVAALLFALPTIAAIRDVVGANN